MTSNILAVLLGVTVMAGSAVGQTLPLDQRPLATGRDAAWNAYLQEKFPAEIQSVEVSGLHVAVTARLPRRAKGSVEWIEVRPYDSLAPLNLERVMPLEDVSGRKASLRVERFDSGYDRLLSKWALVSRADGKPRLLSAARYATDLSSATRWPELETVKPRSKKGLGGVPPIDDLSDLVELGIHNITVNIALNTVLAEGQGIDHAYAGKSYKISPGFVQRLDKLLTFASENEMVVSAILLVPLMPRDSEKGRLLTHPDAVGDKYSMANVTSEEGVNTYAALIDFLAQRYSRPDKKQGRITHWILHNEVDSGWIWTNAGDKAPLAYMDDYIKSMRIVSLVTRSYNPHAQVFISLTHCWTRPHEPDNPHFYAGRDLLVILQRHSEVEGDFPWGVAYHPYPENLLEPRTWLDRSATMSFDTPRITMKNIEVLDRWLRQKPYLYQNQVRTILLSEQGFHTPDYSPESQQFQADALEYTWRKIAPLDSVEAFHYHRWIDHPGEGKLRCGLRTLPSSDSGPLGEKKKAWRVWRELGR